jgi:tetratricopeptide (TPR) repeat protein
MKKYRENYKKQQSPSVVPKSIAPFWRLSGYVFFIIIATIFAYSGTVSNGFVHFDDTVYITENPHLQKGLTPSSVVWAFTAFYASNWHPLTWLSHMLDVTLFGLSPAGHHAMGLLLHILTALVLFGFLRSIKASPHIAALVTALFALHPLHVESVVWASERKDVLSAFFWFATLWGYVRYTRKQSVVRYVVMLVLFTLGLMAKPMLVTLPFVLLLLDFWPLERFFGDRKSIRHIVVEKIPLFTLVVAVVVFTIVAQQEAIAPLERISMIERMTNAVVTYGIYLLQMFVPSGLAVFYPLPKVPQFAMAIMVFCLLTTITLIVIRNTRRHPFLFTGWFWYIVSLIPVIGIVQVGAQAHADRYTYIPLTGIFIMIAWGMRAILFRLKNHQKNFMYGVTVLSLVLLGITTFYQVRTWKDDVALFSHAQAVTVNNYVALNNLGLIYDQTGQTDRALELFTGALTIKPDFAEALNNLGNLMRKKGFINEAIVCYRKALNANPRLARIHSNLAIELAKAGNVQDARTHYLKAIELEPSSAEACYNYGNLLVQMGQFQEAVTYYRKASVFAPDSCEIHNNLGLALARAGHRDEAIAAYNKALAIRPDYAEAYNNLGILYTISGRTEDAIAAYRKALSLDTNDASAYNNLGFVLQLAGKFQEATDLIAKARKIAPKDYRVLTNLSDAMKGSGNVNEAIILLHEALPLAQSAGDTAQVAVIIKKMQTLKSSQ